MESKLPCADLMKIAADLRSQLNQMAAASQILEQTADNEKSRLYLAMANQSICRMLRIVGHMELSHRLSSGQAAPSPRCLNLTAALQPLALRLRGILSEIGVTFTLHAPDHLPICADPELLKQLLLELISSLALAGTEITLSAVPRGDRICLTLSDRGPGQADGRPALPAVLEEQEERSGLELARCLAGILGGTLVVSGGSDRSLTAVVSIPAGSKNAAALESPGTPWHSGGFDPVLIAMSGLLPARSFLPENLG